MPEITTNSTDPYLGLFKRYRPEPNKVDPETQKRIAKGNATAEAFRILLDAVGGAKGANIQKRDAPANAVMGAVEKYYQMKDRDRAEQRSWDQAEMGAEIRAVDTKSQQDFASQKQKESQEFSAAEAEKQRAFQGENAKDQRRFEREKEGVDNMNEAARLRTQAEQFRQTLDLQKKTQQDRTDIDREQIEQQRERYRNIRPYGADKGIYISDPDIQKQIHIPDDKRAQILAFIEADPNVADEIPVMKLRFGNVPPATQAEYLVADLYSMLSPETRSQIRQFLGAQGTSTPQNQKKPGDKFLFYKNPGVAAQTTPTIKKDKNSKTMVTVDNPQPAEEQGSGITPEERESIVKIQSDTSLETKDKASLLYQYLTRQGFEPADAKKFVENLYPELKVK